MTEEERRILKKRLERKRKRQKQILMRTAFVSGLLLLLLVVLIVAVHEKKEKKVSKEDAFRIQDVGTVKKPTIKQDLLPINPYSRPGTSLEEVNWIVVHYTGNPGTTAKQNRDYFASLAETHKTSVSSHYVIGLKGEIIQCVPCEEISYASNERNIDSISIECCIAEESGRFSAKTYDALVQLTGWLMQTYELDTDSVIRHYDVTGKKCPKYYVENESSWRAFKSDVVDFLVQK